MGDCRSYTGTRGRRGVFLEHLHAQVHQSAKHSGEIAIAVAMISALTKPDCRVFWALTPEEWKLWDCQPRRSYGRNNLCRVRSCTLRWRARSRRRLEKSVNRRRERRAISEDQHDAQEQQENQDRRDPPSLTYAQEMQEFLNDCQLHW